MKMKRKKFDDQAEGGNFNLQKPTLSSDTMPFIPTNSHDSESICTSGLKKRLAHMKTNGTFESRDDTPPEEQAKS